MEFDKSNSELCGGGCKNFDYHLYFIPRQNPIEKFVCLTDDGGGEREWQVFDRSADRLANQNYQPHSL